MGTYQGFKMTGRKRKPLSTSTSKKPISVAQNTRSKHFPPAFPVFEEVMINKWEEWEDQVLLDGRKAGRTLRAISQDLPGRTRRGCEGRWRSAVKSRFENRDSQQVDALASRVPRKKHLEKSWEEWEDRIVLERRSAGDTWENTSKMLPLRTEDSVRNRWYRQPHSRGIVTHQVKSQKKVSIRKERTARQHWTQSEEQLVRNLRASGKRWAGIATHLPNRTPKSCKTHWNEHLRDRQGQPKKNNTEWEEWEERLLVSGYFAGLAWKEISEPITRRTVDGIKAHWSEHFCSPDEDEQWASKEVALLEQLRWQGSGWDEITQELPRHTSKACKTQWYKVAEGIQSPSSHKWKNVWSPEEVEVLVALYNTIGPRWQEICKHISGRTEIACSRCFYSEYTKDAGVGGPPSEYWIEYFEGKLHSGYLFLPRCSKLIL